MTFGPQMRKSALTADLVAKQVVPREGRPAAEERAQKKGTAEPFAEVLRGMKRALPAREQSSKTGPDAPAQGKDRPVAKEENRDADDRQVEAGFKPQGLAEETASAGSPVPIAGRWQAPALPAVEHVISSGKAAESDAAPRPGNSAPVHRPTAHRSAEIELRLSGERVAMVTSPEAPTPIGPTLSADHTVPELPQARVAADAAAEARPMPQAAEAAVRHGTAVHPQTTTAAGETKWLPQLPGAGESGPAKPGAVSNESRHSHAAAAPTIVSAAFETHHQPTGRSNAGVAATVAVGGVASGESRMERHRQPAPVTETETVSVGASQQAGHRRQETTTAQHAPDRAAAIGVALSGERRTERDRQDAPATVVVNVGTDRQAGRQGREDAMAPRAPQHAAPVISDAVEAGKPAVAGVEARRLTDGEPTRGAAPGEVHRPSTNGPEAAVAKFVQMQPQPAASQRPALAGTGVKAEAPVRDDRQQAATAKVEARGESFQWSGRTAEMPGYKLQSPGDIISFVADAKAAPAPRGAIVATTSPMSGTGPDVPLPDPAAASRKTEPARRVPEDRPAAPPVPFDKDAAPDLETAPPPAAPTKQKEEAVTSRGGPVRAAAVREEAISTAAVEVAAPAHDPLEGDDVSGDEALPRSAPAANADPVRAEGRAAPELATIPRQVAATILQELGQRPAPDTIRQAPLQPLPALGREPLKKLTLALHPAELGLVTVRLRASGQTLDVSVTAERAETHALLTSQRDVLARMLESSGLSVDDITMQVASGPERIAAAQPDFAPAQTPLPQPVMPNYGAGAGSERQQMHRPGGRNADSRQEDRGEEMDTDTRRHPDDLYV
jgi:hypothetical protein